MMAKLLWSFQVTVEIRKSYIPISIFTQKRDPETFRACDLKKDAQRLPDMNFVNCFTLDYIVCKLFATLSTKNRDVTHKQEAIKMI